MSRSAIDILLGEHAALHSVLQSMLALLEEGPEDAPLRFFDGMRAMLFYIDEFPERLHHPRESDLLFPKLVRAEPRLMPVIQRLEADHLQGAQRVRELQHLLLAWELIGDSRRAVFEQACRDYVAFYRDHMRTEEVQLLPVAQRLLEPADWIELEAAMAAERDPLASPGQRCYDRLLARITTAQRGRLLQNG